MIQDLVWVNFSVSDSKFHYLRKAKLNFQIFHYSIFGDKAKFCSSPGNKFFQDLPEWSLYYKNYSGRMTRNDACGLYSGIEIKKPKKSHIPYEVLAGILLKSKQ